MGKMIVAMGETRGIRGIRGIRRNPWDTAKTVNNDFNKIINYKGSVVKNWGNAFSPEGFNGNADIILREEINDNRKRHVEIHFPGENSMLKFFFPEGFNDNADIILREEINDNRKRHVEILFPGGN